MGVLLFVFFVVGFFFYFRPNKGFPFGMASPQFARVGMDPWPQATVNQHWTVK